VCLIITACAMKTPDTQKAASSRLTVLVSAALGYATGKASK